MVEFDLGKSLRSNLIIWFLIFSLVPFSVLAFMGYSRFKSTMEATYVEALKDLARTQAEDIGTILEENLSKLEMISGRTDLIMSRLEEYVRKNPKWYDIFMTDNKGRGLTTKGVSIDVSGSDFFKTVMSTGKSAISTGTTPDKNEPTIILAVSILDPNGNPYGVLGAHYLIKPLAERCKSINLSEGGYSYIVRNDGMVLVHPDETEILKTNYLQVDSPSLRELAKRMISGEQGFGRYEYKGVRKIAAFAPIKMEILLWQFSCNIIPVRGYIQKLDRDIYTLYSLYILCYTLCQINTSGLYTYKDKTIYILIMLKDLMCNSQQSSSYTLFIHYMCLYHRLSPPLIFFPNVSTIQSLISSLTLLKTSST